MPNFTGRVALVTGAAHGQGREHAIQFAKNGADVILVDVPKPVDSVPYPLGTSAELRETASAVEGLERKALVVEADVRSIDAMRAVVADGIAAFGHIDILAANAGVVTYHQLVDMDDQAWQDTIDVNLTGVANSIRAVLPHMMERKYGRIVVTSSQAARRGVPNLSHYAASKWALIGLTKAVALEAAPYMITCNAVLPGAVNTPMMHHDEVYKVFVPEKDAPGLEDMEARLTQMNPMPTTWVEPTDISHEVLHLAAEESRFISGCTVDVAAAYNANYP
ncbi:mycofactocin-coupled SDR family oxidoreductase [Dactylosporangium sp. AC04546]|uniref:mycofactocin-coupled SDR family oxidoreductase n=1 Tax=Dactylosporangium sp. AC04546 TaxID=2862460 RepID=UPI001EDF8D1C|nr:mycofactocin-coupled SDR family oxidoreductase [Dactylosporangium sp. AC04546]WVK86444.1 mycofactocin-coupled SDR family oxidoreductase [Dactylosporangium sp. AC04546]